MYSFIFICPALSVFFLTSHGKFPLWFGAAYRRLSCQYFVFPRAGHSLMIEMADTIESDGLHKNLLYGEQKSPLESPAPRRAERVTLLDTLVAELSNEGETRERHKEALKTWWTHKEKWMEKTGRLHSLDKDATWAQKTRFCYWQSIYALKNNKSLVVSLIILMVFFIWNATVISNLKSEIDESIGASKLLFSEVLRLSAEVNSLARSLETARTKALLDINNATVAAISEVEQQRSFARVEAADVVAQIAEANQTTTSNFERFTATVGGSGALTEAIERNISRIQQEAARAQVDVSRAVNVSSRLDAIVGKLTPCANGEALPTKSNRVHSWIHYHAAHCLQIQRGGV